MRHLTIIAAAAAAVLAGPALAADPVPVAPVVVAPTTVASYTSGNIAAWGAIAVPTLYRGTNYDEPICIDEDAFFDWNQDWCRVGYGFGGDGRVHFARGALGFQIEYLGEFMRSMALYGDGEADEADPDPENHGFHLAGAAHLILRSTAMPVGVFGAVTYTRHMADNDRPVHAMAGVEFARIGATNTVYAQMGGLFLLAGDDALGRMYFGRVGFRHFLGENAMIEAAFAGGYSRNADSNDDDLNTAVWLQGALSLERGIGSGPLSFLAGYQADYYRVDDTGDAYSVLVHTFRVGLRASFGGTLAEQNATGARTFTLPNLFAPISYTGDMN